MEDITKLEDYRDYLKIRFSALKRAKSSISHKWLAKRLGLSPSFLSMVLAKQRHIAVDKLLRIPPIFKVPQDDAGIFYVLYLRSLTKKGGAPDPTIEAMWTSIVHTRKNFAPAQFLYTEGEAALVSDQLSAILHPMVDLPDFRDDPAWIQKKISGKPFALEEIVTAVDFLKKNGFWTQRKMADGALRWGHGDVFKIGNALDSGHIYDFLRGYARSLLSMIQSPLDYRPSMAFAMNYSYDKEGVRKLAQALDVFQREAITLSKKSVNPERVICVGGWFASMTRDGWPEPGQKPAGL